MGLKINNITASGSLSTIGAYRGLQSTGSAVSDPLEQLSAAHRVTRVADDPASLTAPGVLRNPLAKLNLALRSAQDGVEYLETAGAAMDRLIELYQGMHALATEHAQGGSTSGGEAAAAQQQYVATLDEIDRVFASTSSGGTKVFDYVAKTFQTGTEAGDAQTVFAVSPLYTVGWRQSITNPSFASAVVSAVEGHLPNMLSVRDQLDDVQVKVGRKVDALSTSIADLTAADPALRALEAAASAVKVTRSRIVSEASTSLVAQLQDSGRHLVDLITAKPLSDGASRRDDDVTGRAGRSWVDDGSRTGAQLAMRSALWGARSPAQPPVSGASRE